MKQMNIMIITTIASLAIGNIAFNATSNDTARLKQTYASLDVDALNGFDPLLTIDELSVRTCSATRNTRRCGPKGSNRRPSFY